MLSIQYRVAQQVPFRLLYKLEQNVRPPSLTRKSVSNFVFVVINSKSQAVDLLEVVYSCTIGRDIISSSVFTTDFTQVILDDYNKGFAELLKHVCTVGSHILRGNFLIAAETAWAA